MSNEQLGAEEAVNLREAALRLKALIEAAIDGIIVIDQYATIESINPAAAELFGYQPEEVIGRNVKILMPEPDRSQHDTYLDRYHRTGNARIIGIGREVTALRKDGHRFPVRLAVSQVDLKDRILYTGIIHDLSDVKAAEAKILRLNEHLEEKVVERTEKLANAVNRLLQTNRSLTVEMRQRQKVEQALKRREVELESALDKERELNNLKSRFVSMASHEFRTPLSTVLSSIELVEMYREQSGGNPRQQKHIERIKAAVHTMTGILNDFLSLSRLEEGQVQPRPRPIDFRAFAKEVIESVQAQLKEEQQILFLFPEESTTLQLDPELLRNVLLNLLSNAIKYSPVKSKIELRVKRTEAELQLEVIDQGIGIPETDQKHLFTRFFRAHNVENIKGTGLGLHIVRRYVDIMGGRITFESTLGVGSTFRVQLPIESLKN